MLLSFWRSFGGELAVGLHPLLRLLDLRLLGLEPAGLFGVRAPLVDTLVDPLLLVLHPLLDARVVGAVVRGLGLTIGHFRRNKKRQPCDECELEIPNA